VHPESQGKILEIAFQLGKKTGMLNFCYVVHYMPPGVDFKI